ncbi:hypothetical protein Pmani_006093 [Petrolisthes manimaculis]|uniref:Uncharacterized protein n=1 Tax=Petrolisthes manimaculis TaxID=1843537 RepID=A0AAE1UGU8_9EUCA|nr:hypothetical protein Pmani_006093 [Petrolisthes manimaculis]
MYPIPIPTSPDPHHIHSYPIPRTHSLTLDFPYYLLHHPSPTLGRLVPHISLPLFLPYLTPKPTRVTASNEKFFNNYSHVEARGPSKALHIWP